MDKHIQKRAEHNRQLLEKMRKGESLALIPTQATWFPPRPIIQKDQKAMGRLYGGGAFDKPLDLQRIKDAFLTGETKKPADLIISAKGWKMLLKVREIEPDFCPSCEAAIWMRAEQMGL